jgi:Co/Zn/Cd efflux system component
MIHNAPRNAMVLALIINLIMIGADLTYGLMMNSASLLGDAANNSGDAFIFLVSVIVLSSSTIIKNRVALFKGIIMLAFSIWAFYHVYLGLIGLSWLSGGIVTAVGLLSLIGNSTVAVMMHKYQDKDLNFKSAFICCRNDAIASLGVVLAGILVWVSNSHWPDIIIGAIIAGIACWGGATIIRLSILGLNKPKDDCC